MDLLRVHSQDLHEHIAQEVGECLESGLYTDLAIRCAEGQTLHAHRLVMAAVSPYLQMVSLLLSIYICFCWSNYLQHCTLMRSVFSLSCPVSHAICNRASCRNPEWNKDKYVTAPADFMKGENTAQRVQNLSKKSFSLLWIYVCTFILPFYIAILRTVNEVLVILRTIDGPHCMKKIVKCRNGKFRNYFAHSEH
jgi:hypothetical protein